MSVHLPCALLLLLCTSCQLPVDLEPATPQRPTLSSDTATTRHGSLELEAGGMVDPGDSFDVPLSLKAGMTERTEVFLNWSPYQWQERGGPNARGAGDLGLGTRTRFREETDSLPSAAVQFVTKVPTGDRHDGLSTGELDLDAAAIATKSLDRWTGTLYYDLGFLGETGGGFDVQHSLAVAVGTPLVERLTGYVEIATVRIREQRWNDTFTTFGVAYPLRDSLILDAGAVVGLSDDATDFALTAGFTVNFGDVLMWLTPRPAAPSRRG